MKGWQVGLIAFLSASLVAIRAAALAPAEILFSEVQTGSKASTGEDFVELHNQTDVPIDVTTWRLDYRATSSSSQWTKKAQLLGSIPAHGYYLIATQGYLEDTAQATFTSGLSKTGGSLRLVKVGQKGGEDEVVDLVGWGKAIAFEGDKAAPSPVDGQSLVRQSLSDESLLDTDQNGSDFTLSDQPSPSSNTTSTAPDIDSDTDPSTPGTSTSSDDAGSGDQLTPPVQLNEANADVWITELLADPASPQTDTADEFIELYNAGATPAYLKDYVLETGSTYSHHYVLGDVQLAVGEYRTFSVDITKLSLSNSGSRARLVSPSGKIISETPAYTKAETGQSFALGGGGEWTWTTQVTPNQANVITAAVSGAPKTTTGTSAAKNATTKTSTKSTTTKNSTAKASASKTSGMTTTSTATDKTEASTKTEPSKLNPKWLVALGSSAVLYGAYEYREDIGNKFQQFRSYRRSRQKVGR